MPLFIIFAILYLNKHISIVYTICIYSPNQPESESQQWFWLMTENKLSFLKWSALIISRDIHIFNFRLFSFIKKIISELNWTVAQQVSRTRWDWKILKWWLSHERSFLNILLPTRPSPRLCILKMWALKAKGWSFSGPQIKR